MSVCGTEDLLCRSLYACCCLGAVRWWSKSALPLLVAERPYKRTYAYRRSLQCKYYILGHVCNIQPYIVFAVLQDLVLYPKQLAAVLSSAGPPVELDNAIFEKLHAD